MSNSIKPMSQGPTVTPTPSSKKKTLRPDNLNDHVAMESSQRQKQITPKAKTPSQGNQSNTTATPESTPSSSSDNFPSYGARYGNLVGQQKIAASDSKVSEVSQKTDAAEYKLI